MADQKMEVGIEYSWWRNKFGLQNISGLDTNESAVSLLIKAHL